MQSRCFVRKHIDFKYKIINNAFKQKLPQFSKLHQCWVENLFLRLAFEEFYLWNKECLGLLACGFEGKFRLFEWG